jgi:hypothetical protein
MQVSALFFWRHALTVSVTLKINPLATNSSNCNFEVNRLRSQFLQLSECMNAGFVYQFGVEVASYI